MKLFLQTGRLLSRFPYHLRESGKDFTLVGVDLMKKTSRKR